MRLEQLLRKLKDEVRTVRSQPEGIGLVVLDVELVESTCDLLEASQAWIRETLARVDQLERKMADL